MKKINHFMIAGAALLMLAGCSTDELSGNKEGQIPVRLSVSQQTATMRAADGLYTNTTGFDGNEQVEVYVNSNDKHATFTVGTQDSEHKSELTGGTLYYPTSGDASLYAVYPAASATAGSHTVKYDQTSDANYKASDLMYAKKTVTQANKTSTQDLQFSHKLVKLKVVIIKAADVSQVTKVEMKNVKRKATVSLTTSALTLSDLTSDTDGNGDNILVSSAETSSASEQTYTYAVVFPVQSWSDADFITVTADGKDATYKLTKDNFVAGSEYTLTLNINAAALDNTVSITNWTGNEGTCTVNPTAVIETKLAAVAIGMHVGGSPSGAVLKWANMNVGASSETDYGSYFFWAGVAGYGGANASGTATDGFSFVWANTPYYNYSGEASFEGTKYNSSDSKTTLESMDDAATVHFGSPWRMPTQAEMQELATTYNTDANAAGKTHLWEWKNNYKGSGHAGYLITYKSNGNSIFLPAAGGRDVTDVSGQGGYGLYWSSSLDSYYPNYALYLTFYSGGADMSGIDRYYGCTVRAVCEE